MAGKKQIAYPEPDTSTGFRRAAERKREAVHALQATERTVPPTPDESTIEGYCRTLIPGYDPWRDAGADYVFSPSVARREVLWFHEHVTHVKGALGGKGFALEPWQQAIWANLFGWFHRGTGLRRYRTCDVFVPEKNGKTPLIAAAADRIFIEDDEPGAEVYTLAYTREQAKALWQWSRGIIVANKELYGRVKTMKHVIHRLLDADLPDESSWFKTVPAQDEESAHGYNVHGLVVEELHTFDVSREDTVETMESKTKARRQPLVVRVSTAGWDRTSLCYRVWERARAVRDGKLRDARHLPAIWEASPEDDWTDEAVWRRANPNYGVSFSEDQFQDGFAKAKEDATKENRFKRLNLNLWTQQQVRWIKMEDWDACGAVKFQTSDLAGKRCFAGLDLGVTRDLTAFVLVFPCPGPSYKILAWHWLPADGLREREERDNVPYSQWIRDGYILTVPGSTMRNDALNAVILECDRRYKIHSLGMDPYNSRMWAPQFAELFDPVAARAGKPGRIVEVQQGVKQISEPSRYFEKLVVDHTLHHNDNPVLRWQAGNLEAYVDNHDNIQPRKAGGNLRIDGIMAIIDALRLAIAEPEVKSSRGGILWL